MKKQFFQILQSIDLCTYFNQICESMELKSKINTCVLKNLWTKKGIVNYIVKFGFSEKATKFEKIFVVLLTRASCSVHAIVYLSKSWRRFSETNVDKSYYTNFTYVDYVTYYVIG